MSDFNFKVKIKGNTNVPDDLVSLIYTAFKRKMFMAERISKQIYLSGPRPVKLGVVTGRLRNSIKSLVKRYKTKLKGQLGTNVVYGRRHELGDEIMPKRPFIEPALDDIFPSLEKEVQEKIVKAWEQK